MLFIGHAGGGYQGTKYTNSLDALEQNYREGLRFFELDFMRTKDGKIVCTHDWRDGQMTYEEFRKKQKFNSCDLDSLGQFLAAKRDAFVILDTKMDERQETPQTESGYAFFSEVVGHLSKGYAIALERIVPQAYSLAETKQCKADGSPL
jgi:glycerophosphoryl diester phosphodiesterase